ncbi:Hypothetical protein PSEBR_m1754 [Pseudomonas brassicacearum subsp. brassicacearum NFM421]|uniref:Secreted protein n=1 Tax=Pseudomonas brassicacearum (strain NFM421) TaxID=994484 RepID=F2K7C8_PSEBN|nr:Hypothetical protein PSEBR_m1754 [Pseudomonas brassicacearum subsp. brassicacearum NFM421]
MENSRLKKLKRKKFIKSLFLCLFLLSHLSVDNVAQAFIFNMYRDSKPCGQVAMRGLDNRCKPVDEWACYPQRRLSSVLKGVYQPTSMAVIHRA